ncbi:RNA-guided pseudouridylation complex pseudouridine synthase subunit Cbf5 [Candidatus Woesearchaeota archaeon]|nr:MAG: RNA-guided pseudouridylation complex pseudouridine synthase subunit Cbf5 [Candidatus Woesearchaeota archaeon]
MQLPFERIKREIIVKKKSEPSSRFGKKPEERTAKELASYGIINVDKPSGPSSHQVSAYVRQILEIEKTGHSGTLDPKVTGVLPVALGRGTRIVQSLLNAGKEYICLMHLHHEVPEKKLRAACESFVGKIKQLPPVKSAVKRQERWRKIYYLEILEIKEQDVLFLVGCQAGTYIRKLVHDIGQKIGGAHMIELRRTKAGPFNESSLVTLQELKDAFIFYKQGNDAMLKKLIMPIERGVEHLAKIWIADSSVDAICHGAQLKVPGVAQLNHFEIEDEIAIMTLKNELVAVGHAAMKSKDVLKNEKGVVVKLNQVFMQPNVYPKMERS